jgi:hypothetical protein
MLRERRYAKEIDFHEAQFPQQVGLRVHASGCGNLTCARLEDFMVCVVPAASQSPDFTLVLSPRTSVLMLRQFSIEPVLGLVHLRVRAILL